MSEPTPAPMARVVTVFRGDEMAPRIRVILEDLDRLAASLHPDHGLGCLLISAREHLHDLLAEVSE